MHYNQGCYTIKPAAFLKREKNMVKDIKDAEGLLQFVAEESIVYVDFRFTDYKGKWHHVSYHHSVLNEDFLEDGLMFDGSSLPG